MAVVVVVVVVDVVCAGPVDKAATDGETESEAGEAGSWLLLFVPTPPVPEPTTPPADRSESASS